MKNTLKLIGLFGLTLLFVVSCQKNDRTLDNYGTLRISITDDPFPIEYIEEANVVITKVEIRKKDNHDGYGNGEDNGYPFMTLLEDTLEFNLLELRNGITAELLEMDIPVGEYDLLRLYVDEASIVIQDHGTYDLKVPSGAQTGIKIFIEPAIMVEGGLTADLLLDFNLEKSFVLKGNMHSPAGINGFNFKPVIRAVNNSTAGMVKGVVSDTASVAIDNASVWIMADTTIATAYTDTTGYYALPGIPEGTYSLYATKENYDTVMYDNVIVKAANLTVKDFVLTPKDE
ncbi:MAG: DUF4382 domain-containing protein [Bacteroidales bacterium]|nr:DUF4382 domain-containing protein [Bacteroidales bacterium]